MGKTMEMRLFRNGARGFFENYKLSGNSANIINRNLDLFKRNMQQNEASHNGVETLAWNWQISLGNVTVNERVDLTFFQCF